MVQWYLLRDSSGKKSVSFTMMVVTFLICTIWLLLSIFENIGGWDVREFSAEAASIWFGPIAALYFGRKWQNAQDSVKGTAALKSSNQKQEEEASTSE